MITMMSSFFSTRWNNILSIALGIVALIVFIAFLATGVGITSFIVLVVIGGVTWLIGEGRRVGSSTKKRFTHPATISGVLLGGAALAIIVLTFTGTMEYMTGFIVLSVIIFVKIGLNILRNAALK